MLSRKFSILENTGAGKSYIMTFAFLFLCLHLFSQSITPQQQAKIDSLSSYIHLQLSQGKVPDQQYIDSVNAVIRKMNSVTPQDSTAIASDSVKLITKQSLAGSTFTVPAGKTWKVKRVYVNDGGSYNILVTSVKYEKVLAEGEKIIVPSWTAEAELLGGDKSSFFYIYQLEESVLKR
jgi:hypothetical protein